MAEETISARTATDVLVHLVEQRLSELELQESPTQLYEPIRYVFAGGGKRLRPVLVLLSAEIFGGRAARERALPAALAVEIFHNFTLVHDDIMDKATTRRGRSTVHTKWDIPTAILCGDLMMGMAYQQLVLTSTTAKRSTREAVFIFQAMVERLCQGQMLDMVFEGEENVTVKDYEEMIDAKTGALIQACLELGGYVGGADGAQRDVLRQIGKATGRAFQIQDDLLDLTADHAKWGKVVGGDLLEGKKTFLLLTALESANEENKAFFQSIVENGGLDESKIEDARSRMMQLGVLEKTKAEVRKQSEKALSLIKTLPESSATENLVALVQSLISRVR